MTTTNILLVEDHVLTRMGTLMAINGAGGEYKVVAEAGSVAEAKDIISKGDDIGLVLLDLMLPDGYGLEVVEFMKSIKSPAKILVLSSDNNKNNILQLLDAGIDGFISKFVDVSTLIYAIESVSNGLEYLGKDISEIIHAVATAHTPADNIFTNRETEIIQLCAKGYMSKEIADELNISNRTVENHKNNIFKKLGFNTTGELIRYAYEHGIINDR